jgi:hypothetical protein
MTFPMVQKIRSVWKPPIEGLYFYYDPTNDLDCIIQWTIGWEMSIDWGDGKMDLYNTSGNITHTYGDTNLKTIILIKPSSGWVGLDTLSLGGGLP